MQFPAPRLDAYKSPAHEVVLIEFIPAVAGSGFLVFGYNAVVLRDGLLV